MLEAMRTIFGTYEPVVVVVDGLTVVPSGLAGVNMEYVSQVMLFALCLYSVFRILGAVVRGL